MKCYNYKLVIKDNIIPRFIPICYNVIYVLLSEFYIIKNVIDFEALSLIKNNSTFRRFDMVWNAAL